MPLQSTTPPAHRIATYWAYVEQGPDCWEWLRARYPTGYGRMWWNGRVVYAHQIAWTLASGIWPPDDQEVCHTCDNPGCVRNDDAGLYQVGGASYPRFGHLFLAPPLQNIHDSIQKGRRPTGRHPRPVQYTRPWPSADTHNAVLIEWAAGTTQGILARRYGVSQGTISKWVRGLSRTQRQLR